MSFAQQLHARRFIAENTRQLGAPLAEGGGEGLGSRAGDERGGPRVES